MVGDVVAVDRRGRASTDGVGAPGVHLVGHSLGGAVVSAAGRCCRWRAWSTSTSRCSWAAFKEQLVAAEAAAARPRSVPVRDRGDVRGDERAAAVDGRTGAGRRCLRRPDQDVILGVWELLLTSPESEIAADRRHRAGRLPRPPDAVPRTVRPRPRRRSTPSGWPTGAGRSRRDSGPTTVTTRTWSTRTGSSSDSRRVLGWLSPTSAAAPTTAGVDARRASAAGRWRWPCSWRSALQFSLPDRHVLSPTFLFPIVEVLPARRADDRRPGPHRSPLGRCCVG